MIGVDNNVLGFEIVLGPKQCIDHDPFQTFQGSNALRESPIHRNSWSMASSEFNPLCILFGLWGKEFCYQRVFEDASVQQLVRFLDYRVLSGIVSILTHLHVVQ